MKCKYFDDLECDFDKPEQVRDDCRSFNCEIYEEHKKAKEEKQGTHQQYINTMVLLADITYEEAEQAFKNYITKGEI